MKPQFIKRRNALYNAIKKPIFIPSAKQQAKNADAVYPFRQSSHLIYLCGYDQPCAGLYIEKGQSILFVHKPTTQQQIWDGVFLDPKKLEKNMGVKVRFVEDMKKTIKKNTVSFPKTPGYKASKQLVKELCSLRLVKDAYEIKSIHKACSRTKTALDSVQKNLGKLKNEAEALAIIEAHYTVNHSGHGFDPIVTQDGSVLHQRVSNKPLLKKNILLIDTGCEVNYYSADVTRSFPTSVWTPKQKKIHNIVARVQKKCIRRIKPGVLFKELEKIAVETFVDELVALNILKGTKESIVKSNAARLFYPHSLGHHVGLDTHDCADAHTYLKSKKDIQDVFGKPLEPGNVITIEPGLYFINELLTNPKLYKKYAAHINLKLAREYMKEVKGVRIEDTIIVTKTGYKIAGE